MSRKIRFYFLFLAVLIALTILTITLDQYSWKRVQSVGLRYDHLIDLLEAFLVSMGSVTSSRLLGNVITSRCL